MSHLKISYDGNVVTSISNFIYLSIGTYATESHDVRAIASSMGPIRSLDIVASCFDWSTIYKQTISGKSI